MPMPTSPTGVPSPYVMHIHPYPTRFHGGIWRRPAFGLPYVRQPFNVIRPSQMMGIGHWDTGSGVFRRPTKDGGGIFNQISGLGDMSPQTKIFATAGVLGFGLMIFLATRGKKSMTPNSSCACGGHKRNGTEKWVPIKLRRDPRARGHIPSGWYCYDTTKLVSDTSQHFGSKKQAQKECDRRNGMSKNRRRRRRR